LETGLGGGVVGVVEGGDGAGEDLREGVGGEGESGGEENDCAHAYIMIRGWGKRLGEVRERAGKVPARRAGCPRHKLHSSA